MQTLFPLLSPSHTYLDVYENPLLIWLQSYPAGIGVLLCISVPLLCLSAGVYFINLNKIHTNVYGPAFPTIWEIEFYPKAETFDGWRIVKRDGRENIERLDTFFGTDERWIFTFKITSLDDT